MGNRRLIRIGQLLLVNLGVFLLALCGIELALGNWLRPNRMQRLNLPRDVALAFTVEGLYPSETGISTYRRDAGVSFNGVDHYHMMRRLNQTTLRTCREMGQVGLDLAAEIRWEDSDFYDFVHNTPQGARKIGLYLHRQLRDQL